jgi:hypothetical protein
LIVQRTNEIIIKTAEALWKMSRIEEAVAVIDGCIKVKPEDTHL